MASSRLRLRLVDMLDKAGIELEVGGVATARGGRALVIASFVAVVASSIALEAVALVIVLVKRGTRLRSLARGSPSFLFPPPPTRLGVTESAHKATEMKILTSKCTAAAEREREEEAAAPESVRAAPEQWQKLFIVKWKLCLSLSHIVYSINHALSL